MEVSQGVVAGGAVVGVEVRAVEAALDEAVHAGLGVGVVEGGSAGSTGSQVLALQAVGEITGLAERTCEEVVESVVAGEAREQVRVVGQSPASPVVIGAAEASTVGGIAALADVVGGHSLGETGAHSVGQSSVLEGGALNAVAGVAGFALVAEADQALLAGVIGCVLDCEGSALGLAEPG